MGLTPHGLIDAAVDDLRPRFPEGMFPRLLKACAGVCVCMSPRVQRSSVTVHWMHRDAARARMRVLVKRILRKYGYPPDLQDAAVQIVLQQAGALSSEWARAA
jgi:Domain of unknown function (DUF3387)